jgi:hypothetical protein
MLRVFYSILTLFLLSGSCATAQKWSFIVYGDSRGSSSATPINTTVLTELAAITVNLAPKPALALVPGDLVYSGDLSSFQAWTNIMAPVYEAGIGVYPVMGNHDTLSVSGYIATFGPSIPDNGPVGELDRTYYIHHSNALFLAFDNYVTPHRANVNWMRAVLQTNSLLHVFAMGHEPAFKATHTDCLDDYPSLRDEFWNFLRGTTSRVYFCGHDHFYDHMQVGDNDGNVGNDVHQLIVGTAGAPLYSTWKYDGANTTWTPKNISHQNDYGYVLVEIDGPTATLTFYLRQGPSSYAPVDTWSYTARPTIVPRFAGDQVTLEWAGEGRLEAASSAAGPWTTLTNSSSPFQTNVTSATRQFYRVRF